MVENNNQETPVEVKGHNLPSRIQVQNQLEQEEQLAQKSKPHHFLTIEPHLQTESEQPDSAVFQPGLDTIGRDTTAVMAPEQIASGGDELATSGQVVYLGKKGGQRSTVISNVYHPNAAGSVGQSAQQLNATSSASGRQYLGIAQNSMDELQNKTISQQAGNQRQPVNISVQQLHASESGSYHVLKDGYSIKEEGAGLAESVSSSKRQKRLHSAQKLPKTPPKEQKVKMNEVISQTLFSSYNDSDSNQTLRFNRHVSRMSMTTNHKDGQLPYKHQQDKREGRDREHSGKRRHVIQKPTNLEVKTQSKQIIPPSVPVQQTYQSLQPVNLGEVGYGDIPMTTLIDSTGAQIENSDLEQAKEKTRLLKQAVTTLTGERNPLPILHSPSKSPKATDYGGMTRSPSGKSLANKFSKSMVQQVVGGAIGAQTTIRLDSPVKVVENERGRKSPFQQTSNSPTNIGASVIQEPIVQVNKLSDLGLNQQKEAAIKRKHQSPQKYNIDSLPQYLDKTSSKEKLHEANKGNKDVQNPGSNQVSTQHLTKSMKKKQKQAKEDAQDISVKQLFGIPSSKQITNSPQSRVPLNVAEETQLLQSLGSDLQANTPDATTTVRNQFVTQDKQFQTIALSPMASGSDIGREKNNMTGMFSNSSDPNSQMLQSGLSYHQNRKRLLRDAGLGTQNSKEDQYGQTFRSLTTDKKTTFRNRVQDIITGAQQEQQIFNELQELRKHQRQGQAYKTPIRQRNENGDLGDASKLGKRSSSVARATQSSIAESHMNTMEAAAQRNMFGKYPEKLVPERNVHFAQHRSSEPSVRKAPVPFRPTFPPVPEHKKKDVPRSLYYSNGYMPKLSDLRDALRNNTIFHNSYNPHLDTKEIKRDFATAIKRQPCETPGKIDEEYENQPVLDMLIPVHQAIVDKRQEKYQKELNYQAALHTKAQQKKTIDRLINLKVERVAQLEKKRQQEVEDVRKKAETFRARINPFKNHDTAESIEKFLALEARDPKRNLLFNFIAEKRFQDIILPQSLFDCPLEQQHKIARFIKEENSKMRAAENEQQKFDRLKREVEALVEQGYTFKQQPARKTKSVKTGEEKNTTQATETQQESQKDQNQNQMMSSIKRLSLSPSFGTFSMKSNAAVTARLKKLDPTVVNNDLEAPQLTGVRQRPALDFVPIGARKPKQLKASIRRKGGLSLTSPTKQQEEQEEQSHRTEALQLDAVAADMGTTVDFQRQTIKSKMLSTVQTSIGEDLKHVHFITEDPVIRVSQIVEPSQNDIRISTKEARELRKSREQLRQTPGLNQTHPEQLRASKNQPLEFARLKEECDMTEMDAAGLAANDEGQVPAPGKNSSITQNSQQIFNDTKSEIDIKSKGEVNIIDYKRELNEDIRKSMVRDHSEILQPLRKSQKDNLLPDEQNWQDQLGVENLEEDDDSQVLKDRIMINSNSVDAGLNLQNTLDQNAQTTKSKIQQPFTVLSPQQSAQQLTMAPSILTQNLPQLKAEALEKLLAEKRVEMLHKPDLNKSSCNHCIRKAVDRHGKVMEQFSHLSVQSTQAASKVSVFDRAAGEFLTISGNGDSSAQPGTSQAAVQGQQYLAANFSMSHIPTTQFDSHSHLVTMSETRDQKKLLARNAPQIIKGLLAQCDTHGKISKHMNEEIEKDLTKQHQEVTKAVTSINMGIHSVLEAEYEVPLWNEIMEIQKLESANNETVIADSVKTKQNINPEEIMMMLKHEQQLSKSFKPSKFRWSPDIEKFLKQRFQRSND